MRSVEAWKRKQLKNPKFKAEYDALEEEFVLAAKKIEARKKAAAKKKSPARTKKSPPARLSRRSSAGAKPDGKVDACSASGGGTPKKKVTKNPNRGSSFDSFLKEEGILNQVTATVKKRIGRMNMSKSLGAGENGRMHNRQGGRQHAASRGKRGKVT